jgi:integrase
MADGVFRRCSCGKRVPDGQRTCPREGCTGRVRWAFVAEIGSAGNRRQLHRSGYRTKDEAAEERARVVTERADATFVAPSRLTLGEYLDNWIAKGGTQGWSPNTMGNHRTSVMHLKRRLASVPLQRLTRDILTDFFDWLLREGRLPRGKNGKPGPLKPGSVAVVHTSLRLALAPAVEDKKIRTNVAVGAFRLPKDGGSEEPQAWSLEEMRAFVAFIAAVRDAGLYAVALATGMRRGELLGLRWRDVDLVHGRIDVRRQWTKAGDRGWHMARLKTGSQGLRTIEIDQFTVAALQRQLELVTAEKALWGSAYDPAGLVFPREDGKPQSPTAATRWFKQRTIDCPGVPAMVFHGMRHTHATLLLEDGVSLKVVARRLGDREDTVLKTYGHVMPRGMAIATSCVESWFAPAGSGDPADELARLRARVQELERLLLNGRSSPAVREQSVSDAPAASHITTGTPDASN